MPILNPEAPQIPLRGGDGGMPQNSLEVVEVPASPQIINRKRMTKRMPRTTNTRDAGLPAHDLKISFRVPHRKGRSSSRAKDSRILMLGKMPVQDLAQFNAHWYESLFVALSVNQKNEVVQVHILARQAQQLAYPQAGVEGDKGNGVRPRFVTPDGLPVYKPADLVRAKRRQDFLFFF